MVEQCILWISLICNPIAATVLLFLLLHSKHEYMNHKVLRAALVIGVIGLYGQAYRSYVAVDTGLAPQDDELIWWFGKDLSLITLSFYLVVDMLVEKISSGE